MSNIVLVADLEMPGGYIRRFEVVEHDGWYYFHKSYRPPHEAEFLVYSMMKMASASHAVNGWVVHVEDYSLMAVRASAEFAKQPATRPFRIVMRSEKLNKFLYAVYTDYRTVDDKAWAQCDSNYQLTLDEARKRWFDRVKGRAEWYGQAPERIEAFVPDRSEETT